MPSKGGGVTEVSLRISPDNFEDVAKAMLTADEDAAIRAFGAALQSRKPPHSNWTLPTNELIETAIERFPEIETANLGLLASTVPAAEHGKLDSPCDFTGFGQPS